MRKNKYDDKFYAKYKIRKIERSSNDDSGLIESNVRPSGMSR